MHECWVNMWDFRVNALFCQCIFNSNTINKLNGTLDSNENYRIIT